MGAASAWARAGSASRIVVNDGVAKHVEVEAPKEFKVSSAEYMLRPAVERYFREASMQLFELRHDREEVADQAEVGDLEDRRFGILVDRDDRARILDARQVLDRAGNSDRDVQLRRDDLAGLPHLQVVRRIAGIDRGARGADCRTELVGQPVDDLEILGAASARPPETTRAALCRSGRSPPGGGQRHEARVRRQRRRRRGRFDRRRCRRRAAASNEAVRTVATILRAGGDFHRDDRIAGVDRPAEARGALDRHDVADTCGASSSAATRGIRSLPNVVEGPSTCVKGSRARRPAARAPRPARARCAGIRDLRARARRRASCAACAATGEPGAANTATAISAPASARGAPVTHLAVPAFSLPPACSAMIRILLIRPAPCLSSSATSSAASLTMMPFCAAGGRLGLASTLTLAPLRRRRARPAGCVASGFFFAFMMSGSFTKRGSLRRRSVVMTAGRSTSSVSRPASTSRVTFALLSASSSFEANVACGRSHSAASIWPVWLLSSSMACLPRMTRNGCSRSTSFSSTRATASGSSARVGHDVQRAVRAHGERVAQLRLAVRGPDGRDDDFVGAAALLDAQRLFEGDLVEGIDAHLDAVEHDARAVGLDADAYVVVDDAFDSDENSSGILCGFHERRV